MLHVAREALDHICKAISNAHEGGCKWFARTVQAGRESSQSSAVPEQVGVPTEVCLNCHIMLPVGLQYCKSCFMPLQNPGTNDTKREQQLNKFLQSQSLCSQLVVRVCVDRGPGIQGKNDRKKAKEHAKRAAKFGYLLPAVM